MTPANAMVKRPERTAAATGEDSNRPNATAPGGAANFARPFQFLGGFPNIRDP